jgi:hypothetical protein
VPAAGAPVTSADGKPLKRVSWLGAPRISVRTNAESGTMSPPRLRT